MLGMLACGTCGVCGTCAQCGTACGICSSYVQHVHGCTVSAACSSECPLRVVQGSAVTRSVRKPSFCLNVLVYRFSVTKCDVCNPKSTIEQFVRKMCGLFVVHSLVRSVSNGLFPSNAVQLPAVTTNPVPIQVAFPIACYTAAPHYLSFLSMFASIPFLPASLLACDRFTPSTLYARLSSSSLSPFLFTFLSFPYLPLLYPSCPFSSAHSYPLPRP